MRSIAVRQVHSLLNTGHTQVVDADLSAYFDTIPHAELLKSVARRVVDRHVLHLIKMWLDAPVEETDERGRKKRTTRQPGREARYSPGFAPFTAAVESVHATVCVGVEAAGVRPAARRAASSIMLMIW